MSKWILSNHRATSHGLQVGDMPFGVSFKEYPEVQPGLLIFSIGVGNFVVTELCQSILIHCLLKRL